MIYSMKNTLRVLVSWKCNLKCSYCCNEQARFRKDIRPVTMDEIEWGEYNVYCISGGEPLLTPLKLYDVLERCDKSKMIVLYTNGLLLNSLYATCLESKGVNAINVGLHNPKQFDSIIAQVLFATKETKLSVRFHAQDIYAEELKVKFPGVNFRFWKMDDCDRDNEDRVVLVD